MKAFIKRTLILSALLLSMLTAAGAAKVETYTVSISLDTIVYGSSHTFALPEQGVFRSDDPTFGAQLEDPIALAAYEEFLKITPDTTQVDIPLQAFNLTGSDQSTLPYECFSQVSAAFAAFMFDHPEMHYFTPDLNSGFSFAMSSRDGGKTFSLVSTSLKLIQDQNAHQLKADMDALLNQFQANFDRNLSPIAQYRYIHDYVCDLASYDHEAAAIGGQSDAHSAYGLLVMGKQVVCEGYSKSFKVLCDAVGLPCILVVGEATEYVDEDGNPFFTGVSNHMWNAVRIGDTWYAVDTTWDDFDAISLSADSGAEISFASYDYFLKNDLFLFSNKMQDHRSSGSIYYADYTPMLFGLPELAAGVCPGAENLSTETLHILYSGTDLDVAAVLDGYQVNGVVLSEVPNLNITLIHDQVLPSTLVIPAGMRYTLIAAAEDSAPALRSTGRSVSCADGFDGPMFVLSGSLTLENVALNAAPGKPLAQLEGGSITGFAPDTAYYKPASADIIALRASYDESGRMLSLAPTAIEERYSHTALFPDRTGAYTRDFLLNSGAYFPARLTLLPTL